MNLSCFYTSWFELVRVKKNIPKPPVRVAIRMRIRPTNNVTPNKTNGTMSETLEETRRGFVVVRRVGLIVACVVRVTIIGKVRVHQATKNKKT